MVVRITSFPILLLLLGSLSFIWLLDLKFLIIGWPIQVAPELSVGFNLGMSSLRSPSSSLFFEFVDESPSQDNIQTNFNLIANHKPIVLKSYISYTAPTGLTWDTQLEFGFASQASTTSIHTGLLKRLGERTKDQLITKVGAFIGCGSARLDLGQIYQNDLYIQINGEKFYEKSLAVSYRERQWTFTPQIQFEKVIAKKTSLRINVGYRLPLSYSVSDVTFKGAKDQNGETREESVSLNQRNISLSLDGVEQDRKLLNQKGLTIDVGVAFSILRKK